MNHTLHFRHRPVTSSNIQSVAWNRSNLLEIQFHSGTVYLYLGVPYRNYRNILRATSKGRYFNRNIKDRYPYLKLEVV